MITGQLDLRSADQLIDALDEACATSPPPPLVLDLAGSAWCGPSSASRAAAVNDYVTWIVIGIACLRGALAFSIQ